MTSALDYPLRGRLRALNIGGVSSLQHGGREIVTAYRKAAVEHALHLGRLGFPGDEHVYEHHGGPDKAVCVYSFDHYAYWEDRLGLGLPQTAAFGENFTVDGLLERDVHLGDVFTIGDAVVQVTQPRAPCYKIAARYNVAKMALYVQQQGFTGFLLRVLDEGVVTAGQELVQVSRERHGVSVAEANRILNVDRHDVAGARRLLALPGFPPGQVAGLERRIERHGDGEDRERMFGDAADGVPVAPAERENGSID